jgi:hypothetical protein
VRLLAACVLLFGACGDDNTHRQPPPGGSGGAIGSGGAGGTGGSGGSDIDASPTLVDGTVVCYAHTNRAPCSGISYAGANVTIFGGATAAVDATTGAFEIDATGLTTAEIRYQPPTSGTTEPAIVVTTVPNATTLRTISNDLRMSFTSMSLLPLAPDAAWVMAFAVDANNMPQANFKVQNAPVNQDVWYDDLTGGDFISHSDVQTGPAGLAVFPNVNPGNLQFEFAAANGSGTPALVNVDVVAGYLTIVLVRVL